MFDRLINGFKLGLVEVKPADRLLIIDDSEIHIEPKTMAVLVELAAGGQKTVSREQLVDRVWPRGHVTDDVLNRCISQLRIALGDSSKSPEFIVTVPRIGYRLAKQVELVQSAKEATNTLVLPFQTLSASDDLYIADGLTELLIARLSMALDRPVISRTTAMTFRNSERDLASISQQLGVRWVIEGSILQLGEQVQIVVQLIDAITDTHIWAETWTRPIGDMLSILNEIARDVATRVRSEIQPGPSKAHPVDSLPATLLREYMHGIQLNNKRTSDSLHTAIECFQSVLAVHPNHAPTLSGMAMSHVLLGHYGALPTSEWFEKGRTFALAALESNPEQASAMADLAAVSFHFDWDIGNAQQIIEKALQINPNLEMALVLSANINLVNHQNERAMACIDRALTIDPLNIGLLMNSGDHLILQRRYGEAIESLQAALSIEPRFRPACFRLALAYAFNGNCDMGLHWLNKARELGSEDGTYYEFLAIVEGASGKRNLASEAARKLAQAATGGNVLPWSLARAWSMAGDEDQAMEHLQAAYDLRSSSMPFLAVTPVFDSIRQRPEVQALINKFGLVG